MEIALIILSVVVSLISLFCSLSISIQKERLEKYVGYIDGKSMYAYEVKDCKKKIKRSKYALAITWSILIITLCIYFLGK